MNYSNAARSFHLVLAGFICAAGVVFAANAAQAQIKQPGAHTKYSVELEPHGVVQWNETYWANDALGLGLRATIPFLDNGPISSINNNMGIGFGLDWTFTDNDCYYANRRWGGCDENHILLPVVLQWNFFLTPKISVFGEPGLAIHHESWDYGDCDPAFPDCRRTVSRTRLMPSLFLGGRFMVSDSVGFLVRLGTPYISLGVSILL